ncbi:ShlB/FhaC/HecB family hemolysin secretion/activation protein [Ursidibacter arcticus]
MKKKQFKLNQLMVLLGVSLAGVASAETLIDVKSFQLVGDIATLSEPNQLAIAEVLQPYQGKNQSLTNLKKAQGELEAVLNRLNLGRYTVVLPEQEIIDGNVYLQLVLGGRGNEVFYKGGKGYEKENIERSLPSLKAGKTYEDGRQWFDKRELNMALENPLKLTRVHYDLDPANNASALTVSGYAPFGKTRSYIAVDNYGSKEFDYARLTLGHINANLTGRDDVLSVNALTNFHEPKKSYALGVNYSLPFYEQHQSVSGYAGFSNLDSTEDADGLPEGLSRKIAKGKSVTAGFKWSYYLPEFGLGVKDQFKVNAGYQYRHFQQKVGVDAVNSNLGVHNSSNYSLAGGYIGLSGEIQPTASGKFSFDVAQHYYSKNFPGSSRVEKVAEFEEKAKSYTLTRYSVGYSQDFAQGWNIDTQLRGQYTKSNLASIDQDSVTGVYNVRGYRYTGLSGDKTFVWKTELSTPRYTNANISGYAFYDWGKVSYNNKLSQSEVLSSAGLGVKARMGLDFDVFVARRLHNHELDQRHNGKRSDRTSVWVKASYLF